MQHCRRLFEDFYAQQTQHRRLTWIPTLGTSVVRATFAKRHDLICNTCQACVLLLFNWDTPYDSEELRKERLQQQQQQQQHHSQPSHRSQRRVDVKVSFSTLRATLGMEEGLLKKMLASLYLGRFKIIQKLPDDSYQVNSKFTCVSRKIKLPTPVQEEVHSRERVEEDRSIAVEAAIVRVMKARKAMTHQELIAEVLGQLSFFKPNPKVIKKRLEHLLDREFLERDREDSNVYRYVA